jgi:hypothetical protein
VIDLVTLALERYQGGAHRKAYDHQTCWSAIHRRYIYFFI